MLTKTKGGKVSLICPHILHRKFERRTNMSTNYATIKIVVKELTDQISELNSAMHHKSEKLASLKKQRDTYIGHSSSLAKEKLQEYNKLIAEQENELAKCEEKLSSQKRRLEEAEKELTALSEIPAFIEDQIEKLVGDFQKFVKNNEPAFSDKVCQIFMIPRENVRYMFRIFEIRSQKAVVRGDRWPDTLTNQFILKTHKSWSPGTWQTDYRPYWETIVVTEYSQNLKEGIDHLVEEVIRRLVNAFEHDEKFRCIDKGDGEIFYIELR